MSLASQVAAGFTRVGAEIKDLRTALDSGWVPCGLVTNYSTPSSGPDQLAVAASGRVVTLGGLLSRTNTTLALNATQTASGVIPAGYRPATGPVVFEGVIGSASNRFEIRVDTDGTLSLKPMTSNQGPTGTVRINMTWGRA